MNLIEKLFADGIASLVPIAISKAFDDYVSQEYHWEITGYRLDWSQHSFHERMLWDSLNDDEVATFMANSGLSKYRRVCAFFSRNEPGVMVSFDYAKDNVDVLSCLSSGGIFLVAVDDWDDIQLVKNGFFEVDGSKWLTSTSFEFP
jgi:hypothetical protein